MFVTLVIVTATGFVAAGTSVEKASVATTHTNSSHMRARDPTVTPHAGTNDENSEPQECDVFMLAPLC